MSDEAIYGKNDRDYHSPFDLGMDPAAVDTIKWLVLGHILYLIGLAAVLSAGIDRGNIWITPLFGLPLIWATRSHRDWGLIGVLVVGFTAAHYLAVELAVRNYSADAAWLPGLVGGAVGGAGSLILCAAFKLLRSGTGTMVFALFGVALLAAVGSVGVYMYLSSARSATFSAELLRMFWVYVPWQLTFAYVLSKVLKPVGPV